MSEATRWSTVSTSPGFFAAGQSGCPASVTTSGAGADAAGVKPYDKERFAKALVHARQVLEQRREANRDLEPLLRSLRSLRTLERFVVKDNKRIFFVPVSNVLWIEATGNYACIHTAGDSHLLRETLAHLEEKLAPHHFIRVRKSAIVNGACISEIRPMFDGVYDIVLAGGAVVTSSRRYAHKLRALLES